MANQPKKKLSKTSGVESPENRRYYCCRCGVSYSRQKGFFSVSHSFMYRGSGFLPICYNCVDELYEYYCKKLRSPEAAMKRMCMKLDLYWDPRIYQMVEKTAGVGSRVRSYIGRTNIVRYIDKTFDDTLDEEMNLAPPPEVTEEELVAEVAEQRGAEQYEEQEEVPDEVVNFWGKGFQPDFYTELERRYKNWVRDLNEDDLDVAEVALYKQICMLEEKISRDTAAGRDTTANIKAMNELLGSVNRKPSQKKAEENSMNSDTTPFGVWIRRWENERPVPEVDPELKDVDGIIRYIEIWFKGHLAKMLGKENAYSRMYEREIEKLRVDKPEYVDEADEVVFDAAFGEQF